MGLRWGGSTHVKEGSADILIVGVERIPCVA